MPDAGSKLFLDCLYTDSVAVKMCTKAIPSEAEMTWSNCGHSTLPRIAPAECRDGLGYGNRRSRSTPWSSSTGSNGRHTPECTVAFTAMRSRFHVVVDAARFSGRRRKPGRGHRAPSPASHAGGRVRTSCGCDRAGQRRPSRSLSPRASVKLVRLRPARRTMAHTHRSLPTPVPSPSSWRSAAPPS
jgi:hypothetical protein